MVEIRDFACELLGGSWLDEPQGQNIGELEPLGPHNVGAYGRTYCNLQTFQQV